MLGACDGDEDLRRLYVLPGSHPCAAVEVALRLKSIAYDRVDLLPMSQMLIGPLRYGGTTVPGLRIDGERLVGSRTIMRRLDELVPEPALLPPAGDPAYARGARGRALGRRGAAERAAAHPRRRIPAPPRRDGELRRRTPSCRCRAPLMRPALPLTAS